MALPPSITQPKLQEILTFKKARITAQEIFDLCRSWDDVYKEDRLKEMPYDDIVRFSDVFLFKGVDLSHCRNELVYWIRNHKDFYNDHPEIMRQRMLDALNDINAEREEQGVDPFPAINMIPQYGGRMQKSGNGAFQENDFWRRNADELPLRTLGH